MLKLFRIAAYVTLSLLILGCNSSESKKTKVIEHQKIDEKYSYAIDTAGVSVLWTSYKFTERLGVSGTFDHFEFPQNNEAVSIEELLKTSKMTIYTRSVNSGNEIRDPKLRTSFFKVFNSDTINASIIDVKQGEGVLDLKMNNIVNQLNYLYSYKRDTLVLSAKIDLAKWKGEEAMLSLNEACDELHKGVDGVSKLWPDVDISIKLPIKATLRSML